MGPHSYIDSTDALCRPLRGLVALRMGKTAKSPYEQRGGRNRSSFLQDLSNLKNMNTSKLVFSIKTASPSAVRALSAHCSKRNNNGWSEIDLSRSQLNRQTFGSGVSISDSLKNWYRDKEVAKPARQSENSYLTLVLSASHDYFCSNEVVVHFEQRAMRWLVKQFGDELVHAELHLDETTPHLHAVVAPTYMKSRRTPGKRRKDETNAEFDARKASASAAPKIRTSSWSSSKYAYKNSFCDMRKSCAKMMSDINLVYGDDRRFGPSGKTTRGWIKSTARTVADNLASVEMRSRSLTEREYELRKVIAKVRSNHQENVNKSNDLATAIMNAQKLEAKLLEVNKTLRVAATLGSMSQTEKAKVELVLDALTRNFKNINADIQTQCKRVQKTDASVDVTETFMRNK